MPPAPNLYARFFRPASNPPASPASPAHAAMAAATAYLDGKPIGSASAVTQAQRDADFWTGAHWDEVPADAWRSSLMTLALSRYFAQEARHNTALLVCLAQACPSVLVKAVRYSGLVLCPAPVRRAELEVVGRRFPEIAELCRVLDVFAQAHAARVEDLEKARVAFVLSAPFEMLVLASLHAFEHLVPQAMASPQRSTAVMSADEQAWRALNDLFLWKLGIAVPEDFVLTDVALQAHVVRHLAPVLRCTPGQADAGAPVRRAFAALLAAQVEVNAFVSQSADAFSYDDGIRFVRHGTVLEIEDVDAPLRAAWARDGRKLARLHDYWLYRAMDEFMASGQATQTIGRPENHDANRLAVLRAKGARLQLTHVYGIADTVTTEAGEVVNVYQALLSMELMSAFFQRDFLEAFMTHLRRVGDWRTALSQLAMGGALEGLQNRMPLTWSNQADKVRNITGWTVSPAAPQGDAGMAAAILEFWCSDWAALSVQLQSSSKDLRPALFERPVLRIGQTFVQLPWQVGLQNNSTAAINNLRRLRHRRGQVRAETQRVEESLGGALAARGFAVVANWMPDRAVYRDAGEVDVVCARDGIVLVIEVKSTFLRISPREAFQHATTTLRRAGGQVRRKVDAVIRELLVNDGFRQALRLDAGAGAGAPAVHGWIVDTSIESDHQRFAGFLKVSLEEVLIALRDDVALLHDPGNLSGRDATRGPGEEDPNAVDRTLYAGGFTAQRFVEVIEQAEVWRDV